MVEHPPGEGAGASPPDATARPDLVVAFHGDLTGARKELGNAQLDGTRLAVEQINAKGRHPFRLKLLPYDDGGDPKRADQLAGRLAKDAAVRAVLGPTTDACFLASEVTYTEAAMPVVSVSVGVDTRSRTIDENQFHHSHAALRVTDPLLAAPCTSYLTHHVDARKVFLVDDRVQGDFSWALCKQTEQALKQGGRGATVTTVAAGKADYTSLAAAVMSARADAVLFTGDAARAAGIASALSTAGFTGTRMATERAFAPRFLTSAGAAATGWVFATSFTDPTARTSARAFTKAYRARYGTGPGWYAAEAFDAVMFLADACTKDGAAVTERGAIARRLPETTYSGITRTVEYEQGYGYNHDAMFLFRATDGAFRYLGQYQEAGVS